MEDSNAKFIVMPTYEFACSECEHEFEQKFRSTQWKGTACPKCGSLKLSKKFSSFGIGGKPAQSAASCSGVPSSCGRCGTGVPHSHG